MSDAPVTPAIDTQITPATSAPPLTLEPKASPEPASPAQPVSPHKQGKSWSDMKGLFDKRDEKSRGSRGVSEKKEERKATETATETQKPSSASPPPEKGKTVAHTSTTTPTDPVAQLLAEEPPEHFEEKGKSHFKAMKEKWASVYRSAQEKVSSLERMLADREGMTKKEVEELKSELSKARRYEYAFDIQADPEFQKKYVTPANEAFKSLGETLKRAGYDPASANQIDWDDEIAVESVAVEIQKAKGEAIASVFRQKAAELRGIRANFRAERDNAITNYDKIIEEKSKEKELKATERQGKIKNTLESLYSKKDDKGQPQLAFLAHKEAPPGADEQTQKSIAEHNRLVDESRKRIEDMTRAEAPEDRAELAVAAEIGMILSHERPLLMNQIKELENQLAEIQGARAMPKSPAKAPTPPKERYQRGASVADAFEKKFGK